jgi:hypothetical protein
MGYCYHSNDPDATKDLEQLPQLLELARQRRREEETLGEMYPRPEKARRSVPDAENYFDPYFG